MNGLALVFIETITILTTISFYAAAIAFAIVAAVRALKRKSAAVFIIIGAVFLVLAIAFTVLIAVLPNGVVSVPTTDYPTYRV